MTWSKPDFVEISLCMEVTAYANTEESVVSGQWSVAKEDDATPSLTTDN